MCWETFWHQHWRHLAMSALVYISDTLLGWHQQLCSPIRDPTQKTQNRTKPCRPLTANCGPIEFDLQLTLTFALTFNQNLKFPKRPILLSFLRKFPFWTPFLHLKLQNWSICTFFIVVSSKTSPRDLLMLIQPQASIKLLPWVWGRVLEIY